MATKPVDFSGMSVPELRELIAAAEARVAEIQAEAKVSMRAQLEELAAKAGFTLEEIVSQSGSKNATRGEGKAPGKPATIKYRGPNGETWSGRGRIPNWLAALVAEGRDKDNYLASQ